MHITLFSRLLKMTGHLTQGRKKAQKAQKTPCEMMCAFCASSRLVYTSSHAEKKSRRRRYHRWTGANELCAGTGKEHEEGNRRYQRRSRTGRTDCLPTGALSLAVLLPSRRYPAL